MDSLDWIILIILSIGVVRGLLKGLLVQLASLAGLIGGLFVARALYVRVGEQMAEVIGTSVTFAQILSFLLIWFLVPTLLSIFASLMTRVVGAVHLGGINRLLGACLGVVKYALFLGLIIHFLEFVDSEDTLIHETSKQSSLLYYPLSEFSGAFFSTLR